MNPTRKPHIYLHPRFGWLYRVEEIVPSNRGRDKLCAFCIAMDAVRKNGARR